jgi:hypothetical protein
MADNSGGASASEQALLPFLIWEFRDGQRARALAKPEFLTGSTVRQRAGAKIAHYDGRLAG